MKQGEHVFILFRSGKTVLDQYNKTKTYKSKASFLKHRGERENEVLIEYAPVVEASWINVTKPGQITCGGNPVYACGRCGDIYGSFEIIPSAKYCRECGAKMLLKGKRCNERVD